MARPAHLHGRGALSIHRHRGSIKFIRQNKPTRQAEMQEQPFVHATIPWQRRARTWLMVGLCLIVAGIVGPILLTWILSDRELRAAIAEADRLDPGWKWADLEA